MQTPERPKIVFFGPPKTPCTKVLQVVSELAPSDNLLQGSVDVGELTTFSFVGGSQNEVCMGTFGPKIGQFHRTPPSGSTPSHQVTVDTTTHPDHLTFPAQTDRPVAAGAWGAPFLVLLMDLFLGHMHIQPCAYTPDYRGAPEEWS